MTLMPIMHQDTHYQANMTIGFSSILLGALERMREGARTERTARATRTTKSKINKQM